MEHATLQTLMASSANGLQFTHHWGFNNGSMTSPDLLDDRDHKGFQGIKQANRTTTDLQMGICIGLSFVSTKSPVSFNASTTAILAWNRFIP
jgi:hypothetical protein